MRTPRLVISYVLLVIMAAVTAWSQVYTGSITGTVKDPSGAVVPNASVTVTDAGKGFTYTANTDANGLYTLRNLSPGTYTERVEAPGFTSYERPNIIIDVAGAVNADVALQLGQSGQTVTVSESSAPLLQTEDAATGQTINRQFINDLPLLGRQVFDLAYLAPGVSQAIGSSTTNNNGIGNNFVSDGSRNGQSDILIDGISSTSYEQNTGFVTPLYTPSVEAVQEFKVQQTNFSAEIGFSGGTVVNVVTRSGTNQFHGVGYDFLRNTDLNANSFFNNLAGFPRTSYHQNQFGGTVGGPIKRDKIFFFFDYDGSRAITPASGTYGVPSQAERSGNFGELCGDHGGTFNSAGLCSVVAGQIFDPWSASKGAAVVNPYGGTISYSQAGNPAGGVRSSFIPFNNMATYASNAAGLPSYITRGVAGNLINPVAAKVIQNFPLPNTGGLAGTTGYNFGANFYGTGSNTGNNNQYDLKLDARPTEFDQVSVRFSQVWSNSDGANIFGNVWDANTQGTNTGLVYSGAVNYSHTFNPTTLLNVTAGYDHNWSHTNGVAAGFPSYNPTSYGLPANLNASGFVAPPAFTIGGYNAENGNANIGGQPWSGLLYGRDVYHVLASVAKTAGNHDLHVGGEFRIHRINFTQFGTPAGLFSFNGGATSQYSSQGGDSMASFLTGAATGWSTYEIPAAPATQNIQYSGFIQDNWHVNSRLTLNLGVRYDVDLPRTERYNRMSFFDQNAASPVNGVSAADCLYCGSLRGSLEYVGQNGYGRSPYQPYYGGIGPRFGFAYRIGQNNTVRGGYGIYYDPSKYGAAGTGSGAAGFLGYDQQTSFSGFDSQNLYPSDVLGQPLAIGAVQGNSLGIYTGLGSGLNGVPIYQFNKLPMEQSWSFGIEHQFKGDILVDAEYVGRKGTHLYLGGDVYALDHLNASVADQFRANPSAFTAIVNTPPTLTSAIKSVTPSYSNGFYNGTWPAFNAFLPYPQYPDNVGGYGGTGLQNIDPPWGNSIYNSGQLRVEKRFSHGLQALFTYTFQKSIDDSSIAGSNVYINGSSGGSLAVIQDPNNLRLDRSVSEFNITQIAQLSFVYNLPFGKGRAFGANWNRLVDGVLGGWHLNGIYRWDSGQPLILGNGYATSIPFGFNQRPNLPYQLKTSGQVGPQYNYFSNASGATGAPIPVTEPAGYTGPVCYTNPWFPCQYADGTAPRVDSQLTAPGTNNLNASLFKDFQLWNESSKLEFRAETFNLLNSVQFGAPNTSVGSTTFGAITSQVNSPRNIQLALKLYF